jgi:hypothetical protein
MSDATPTTPASVPPTMLIAVTLTPDGRVVAHLDASSLPADAFAAGLIYGTAAVAAARAIADMEEEIRGSSGEAAAKAFSAGVEDCYETENQLDVMTEARHRADPVAGG